MPKTLGVVIGRFQTHQLTEGHKHVITQVATRSSKVLIMVGCAPVVGTKRNPLEFKERAAMLEAFWTEVCASVGGPELTIVPALDCPTDSEWVHRLDGMISAIAPGHGATVYGSQDSCLSVYRAAGGRWPTEDIDPLGAHASKLRAAIVPRYSEEFRAGVIYGIERRFVNPFPCVDVAVFRGTDVLLVQKPDDGRHWRFPGGFVDPTDSSFESAGVREVKEETDVRCGVPRYVASLQVHDWRYRGGPEGIMTTLFEADHLFADPVPGDDVSAAAYTPWASLPSLIHPVHQPLLAALQTKRIGNALATNTKRRKQ